jgi:hypothetical protein
MHALLLSYSLGAGRDAEHSELCEQLAPAVAAVRGLVTGTWFGNPETGRYGGFYTFETKSDLDRFVASELFDAIVSHRELTAVTASEFGITARATAITRGLTERRPEDA